ncbi:MAG: beta strand repeat-containing protein, partial [Planctomyces sp.]
MLLNSWLSFARRNLLTTGVRRVNRTRTQQPARLEPLEERKMLAVNALVINQDNYERFTNLAGGLVVTNASLAGPDGISGNIDDFNGLVIQGISLTPVSGEGVSINLSGVPLQRLAFDSVIVESGNRLGINIDLTGVTGLQSVAFDNVDSTKTGRGLDLLMSATDTQSLVIQGSRFGGIQVTATGGADIRNGLISNNVIDAPAGVEGILLDVQTVAGQVSTADGFRIENNPRIATRDRDAVKLIASGVVDSGTRETITSINDLVITGNAVTAGSAAGADVQFRAEGDTFIQPFQLTNTSVRGDLLQTFVFDLRDIGLVFDPDPVTGKPFTAVNNTGTVTGVSGSVLSNNNQTLTVTFADFNPGETLQFLLDIDLVGNIPASIFGNQLIGAGVTFNYTQNKQITGQMAGDPDRQSGSQFLPGAVVAGLAHGINLDASAVPLRNLQITGNTVTGSQGYGLYLNSRTYSDVTGIIEDNQISGSGRDGIRVSMSDSRFAGGIFGNNIANNGGVGLNLLPVTTVSGRVQNVTGGRNGAPFVVTSANHGLQTGQEVILQGIQDGIFGLNHNANGRFLVTRLSNNTFSLQGTGIDWGRSNIFAGGGAWYVPDFRGGSLAPDAARGFAQIDLRVDGVSQPISSASNTSDIEITSAAHGLKTGDQIRITGVQGNSAANGTFRVTVISADRFLLKGQTGNGDYTVGGSFVKLAEAAVSGDVVRQGLVGNLITGNLGGGIRSVSEAGTTVRADVARNTISQNQGIGVHFQSFSFGLGTALPLPTNAPTSTVQNQDLGFNVNIGTESAGQGNISGGGNTLQGNRGAAVALEALDFGTGSFEVWNNTISSTRTPTTTAIPYAGDGIAIRLDDGRIEADSAALLQRSVIRNNVIGVDNLGNAGNGLFFQMAERTRIQDLDVINNTFLNSGRDGFHFERSEDARLNSVKFEKNKSTNNAGDGFDIFAKNTTLDRLDFNINDNFIEDNGHYGLRVDALADARLDIQFDSNSVKRNGHSPGGTGFHPIDGVANSAAAAGGVGIRAFQQIDVLFNATDTAINDNIGDGLSLDAFNFFDTLVFQSSFTRVTMDGNTLTGLRNHGAAFGSFTIVDCSFSNNGEDGLRSVSIEDKSDPYDRRVGGMDLDLYSINSTYNSNGKDGVKLGQGISAAFGSGVVATGNTFDFNGRNGLMITQHNSPYLDNLNNQGNERRRMVQVNFASMSGNGRNGVDIGMDALQEGGNLQHADEVATDVYVTINNADILNNAGDGLEFLGDDTFEVGRVPGGGQDVAAIFNSALQLLNSRVASNNGRGIDILNRHQSDVFVTIRNNDVLGNGQEGIYVLNTASINQLQGSSADPLTVYIDGVNTPNPNMELRIQDNLIQSNGDRSRSSRVPTRFEFGNNDASGVANLDWGPATTFVAGTLGGLVVRVGTAQSSGTIRVGNPGLELGRAGVDAEVWNNLFDGNVGADVFFDNFVSHMPLQSQGNFDATHIPRFSWDQGFRDPLSRFDLSFRGNIGNSLDVMNGFAFLDNKEDYFKSRSNGGSTSPPSDHAHADLNPNGHFNTILPTDRRRNATRTAGFLTDVVGDIPSSVPMIADDGSSVLPGWSYDGLGTPTWRVERDFEIAGFRQID